MGRNCRFLQGPDTDRDSVARIRQAIAARTDIDIEVLTYRKDGTPFWNALYLGPVFDEARARGYIGAGFCAGGYGYLIKRIAALRGVIDLSTDYEKPQQ